MDAQMYDYLVKLNFKCPVCEKPMELQYAELPVKPYQEFPTIQGNRLDTSKAPGVLICPVCHFWEPCNKDAISLRIHNIVLHEIVKREEPQNTVMDDFKP